MKMRWINQRKVNSEGAFALRSTYDSSMGAYTSVPILSVGHSNSDVKKSATLPPKHPSRQRFYDKSYIGHEHEGEDSKQQSGSNFAATLGSSPSLERKNGEATADLIELA